MKKQILWGMVLIITLLYSEGQAQLTYKDVAPVFIERCTDCHHQGKVFPYLTHYSSVSLYKGIISYNLQSGKMPPWQADTTYTRFTHERIITQSEKTTILDWIAAGCPAGDTTEAPEAPQYTKSQLYGTPDLVLSTPKYTSSASFTDKNVCFALPTGLTQNRILRAYEIITGNAHLAHHIIIATDTLGTSVSDLSGSCDISSYDAVIGGWAPGSSPVVFPSKQPIQLGIPLHSGSNIVLQAHYPAGTSGQSDSIQMKLYFYPLNTTGIRNIHAIAIRNTSFTIAPSSTITVTGVYPRTGTLQEDISVFSVFPHSHKICTGIKNYASDGTNNIPLCRIKNWDFEWQGFYTFQKLSKIPAGYRLYGLHLFDNTSANPNSSPLPVSAGPASEDEMLLDMLLCTKYLPGDENIDMESIIESDSLFIPPPEADTELPVRTFAYPNPFRDHVTISCQLLLSDQVNLSIHNMMGQKVRDLYSGTEPAGVRSYIWDGRSDGGGLISTGLYMYKLSIGSVEYCGKILLDQKD